MRLNNVALKQLCHKAEGRQQLLHALANALLANSKMPRYADVQLLLGGGNLKRSQHLHTSVYMLHESMQAGAILLISFTKTLSVPLRRMQIL